jgi:hypothetical protein
MIPEDSHPSLPKKISFLFLSIKIIPKKPEIITNATTLIFISEFKKRIVLLMISNNISPTPLGFTVASYHRSRLTAGPAPQTRCCPAARARSHLLPMQARAAVAADRPVRIIRPHAGAHPVARRHGHRPAWSVGPPAPQPRRRGRAQRGAKAPRYIGESVTGGINSSCGSSALRVLCGPGRATSTMTTWPQGSSSIRPRQYLSYRKDILLRALTKRKSLTQRTPRACQPKLL